LGGGAWGLGDGVMGNGAWGTPPCPPPRGEKHRALLPITHSQLPIPNYQLPIPNSQLPIPNSQFP
ncbi:MAG: hypothetical protein ACBR21_30525, partial [Microcoleus sp.]